MEAMLKFLQGIILMAGAKIPQIWPDILGIMKHIEHILMVVKGAAFGSGTQLVPVSDFGSKLVEDLASKGVDREEAKKVVAVFEQADFTTG